MKNLIYAKIESGKLQIQDGYKELWKNLLERYEGKNINIYIEKKKRIRSLSQNALYWGVVLKSISDYTGYDTTDLHNHFKYHFLKKKVGNLDSFKSTTELSTEEFTWYVDKIIEFSETVVGFNIPTPDQMTEEQIMKAYENYNENK